MCIEREDFDALLGRIDALETRDSMQGVLIEKIAEDTREIVDFFEATKGALKVFHWVGKLAKPIAAVAAAVTAVLVAWGHVKAGVWPPTKP